MASFVLGHSPLVGPSTWRWVAEELGSRGHRVVVPVVPQAVTSEGWEAFVDSVASQAGDTDHAILRRPPLELLLPCQTRSSSPRPSRRSCSSETALDGPDRRPNGQVGAPLQDPGCRSPAPDHALCLAGCPSAACKEAPIDDHGLARERRRVWCQAQTSSPRHLGDGPAEDHRGRRLGVVDHHVRTDLRI